MSGITTTTTTTIAIHHEEEEEEAKVYLYHVENLKDGFVRSNNLD